MTGPHQKHAGPDDAPLIVFAGGGTGGHLYPALAVASSLEKALPSVRIVFFATDRKVDRDILTAANRKYVAQSIVPPSPKPWRWPRFFSTWRESHQVCREFFDIDRPAAVIGTGAFGSVPAVRQAAKMGIPTAILNPDLIPGRANKWLANRVGMIFAQWPESASHFKCHSKVHALGCPIRPDFTRENASNVDNEFGLRPDKQTLLVTGASQGAKSINHAMMHLAGQLASTNWQVLHLTGQADLQSVRRAYKDAKVPAVCMAYTERMAQALAAADLVISRAGASTLAEITALGKPSILLPYPYHRDMHQLANAEVLVDGGAALLCRDLIDGKETANHLQDVLFPVMADQDRLLRLADGAGRMGKPEAANEIASSVISLSQL